MPYINQKKRNKVDYIYRELHKWMIGELSSGELNYLITKIILNTEPESYSDYNKLIGMLECVKMELYRRRIARYEDQKIIENGDLKEYDV